MFKTLTWFQHFPVWMEKTDKISVNHVQLLIVNVDLLIWNTQKQPRKRKLPLKILNSEWWQPIYLFLSGWQLASADVCSDSWPMQPETLKQRCEPKQSLALLCVPEVWKGDFVAAREKWWHSYSSPSQFLKLLQRTWHRGCDKAVETRTVNFLSWDGGYCTILSTHTPSAVTAEPGH